MDQNPPNWLGFYGSYHQDRATSALRKHHLRGQSLFGSPLQPLSEAASKQKAGPAEKTGVSSLTPGHMAFAAGEGTMNTWDLRPHCSLAVLHGQTLTHLQKRNPKTIRGSTEGSRGLC